MKPGPFLILRLPTRVSAVFISMMICTEQCNQSNFGLKLTVTFYELYLRNIPQVKHTATVLPLVVCPNPAKSSLQQQIHIDCPLSIKTHSAVILIALPILMYFYCRLSSHCEAVLCINKKNYHQIHNIKKPWITIRKIQTNKNVSNGCDRQSCICTKTFENSNTPDRETKM